MKNNYIEIKDEEESWYYDISGMGLQGLINLKNELKGIGNYDAIDIINDIIASEYLSDTNYERYVSSGTLRKENRNKEKIKKKNKKITRRKK